MSQPLALVNRLWSGTERHKVALDNVLCVGGIQPQGKRPWELVCRQGILGRPHHADGLRERWGRRQGRQLGGHAP